MKKGLLLLAAGAFALASFSQEYAVKSNKFGDNWFLELKGGASMNVGSDWLGKKGLKDVTTGMAGLSFGKYFNPVIGTRIEVSGWQLKNKFASNNSPLKANYVQADFDAMFNLINAFGKYNPNRVFDLYGIVGIGYMRHLGFDNAVADFGASTNDLSGHTKNYVVPRIGLQGSFHAGKAVDINLEVMGNIINGTFMASDRKYNGFVNATVGVAYKFKKRGFEIGEVVEPGLVASLNDEINKQRGIVSDKEATINDLKNKLDDSERENNDLRAKLRDANNRPETIGNQTVITYAIGKTEVCKTQLVDIYNVAQMLNENPKAKVQIDTYADSKTGSSTRNKYLTEKRAEHIVKLLTENYGISQDRISTTAHGSDQQIYEDNDWNRISVIVVK